MTARMAGKTVLITGGAGGRGLAIARDLVQEGAAVGLLDIDGVRAARAAAEFVSQGARSVGLAADVADWGSVSGAAERIEADLGPVDGLVNNAGIADLGGVHDVAEAVWTRIMDVNVKGVLLASRAVLPGMMARRKGAIVNVSSVAGLVGIRNMAAYFASKGAMLSLTRQMAIDYVDRGVRVNAVAPGTIASTEMGRALLRSDTSLEAQARRLSKYPIGRYGEAEEVSKAVLFLLSEEASFVTGSTLVVDGGMTAY